MAPKAVGAAVHAQPAIMNPTEDTLSYAQPPTQVWSPSVHRPATAAISTLNVNWFLMERALGDPCPGWVSWSRTQDSMKMLTSWFVLCVGYRSRHAWPRSC